MKKKKVRRLSDALKESAMSMGMCDDGIAEWGDYKTLDELCEHYWEGIEFIINHPGWPTNKWLLDNIGIATLHAHGIYIDDNIAVENPQRMVLNGHCKCEIFARGFSTPEIYLRHDSNIELVITDGAIVHINMYDNARLKIRCGRFASCYVYQYGGAAEYEGEGKVIVRERHLAPC